MRGTRQGTVNIVQATPLCSLESSGSFLVLLTQTRRRQPRLFAGLHRLKSLLELCCSSITQRLDRKAQEEIHFSYSDTILRKISRFAPVGTSFLLGAQKKKPGQDEKCHGIAKADARNSASKAAGGRTVGGSGLGGSDRGTSLHSFYAGIA